MPGMNTLFCDLSKVLCGTGGRIAAQVVPVRRWVPDSVSWARLEKAGQMPLERLLSQPAKATTSGQACAAGKGMRDAAACGQIEMDEGDPLYLHDWSLPQNLGLESPLLAGKFRVWFRAGFWRSFF